MRIYAQTQKPAFCSTVLRKKSFGPRLLNNILLLQFSGMAILKQDR